MSSSSDIEWTDASWNPVRGCTKVSPGCKNCYAEAFSERFRGVKDHPYEQGFDLRLVPEALDLPLHWKKPRRIFVNSMSDLFHEDVPDKYIGSIFGRMKVAHWHTFQILTKRARRMQEWVSREMPEPLPNVWLGTSVEDQKRAEERIPWLLDTPAAVRFLSCEPLLGPVNLRDVEIIAEKPPHAPRVSIDALTGLVKGPDDVLPDRLHWVIVGGESGAGAREMRLDWAQRIIDDCKAAGAAVFVKQLGAQPVEFLNRLQLSSRKGGDPEEWPTSLRVREYPTR